MASKFVRVMDAVNKVDRIITGAVFVLMFVSTMIQVLIRQFTTISVPWTDEVARYCIIALVYFGAPLAARAGSLIRMEVLGTVFRLSEKNMRVLYWIAVILTVPFVIIVLISASKLIPLNMNKYSNVLRIPMGYLYMMIPFGCIYILLNMIAQMLEGSLSAEKKGDEK